ncbi:MAG: ribose 5-phosphate isomerase B [Alphaproteobacteria bacterium]|nr:ribose 5-phosphate isomerase B [Rhodospirillales bacterium]MCW9045981.1 ribose 5-phosphate isomerase B [Alphaproteobacteria bacterium]
MPSEKIAIACDHAGYELKAQLVEDLEGWGYEILDLGTKNGTDSVDYPDFADAIAKAITEKDVQRGVLVCGSGIGISIAANRHKAVRAALVGDVLAAQMSRLHNDANVVVFGGRMIGPTQAQECLKIFLNTEFEGGRHQRRVTKMS